MNWIQFNQKEIYVGFENGTPIVKGQLLVCPYPDNLSLQINHRTNPNYSDFLLIQHLAQTGFEHLKCMPVGKHPELIKRDGSGDIIAPYSMPYAINVNIMMDADKLMDHLHINALPVDYVHFPNAKKASWQVCQDMKTGTIISRFDNIGFYALVVDGADFNGTSSTLARFHQAMIEWKIPYNLIAYPLTSKRENESQGGRILVVPLGEEHCDAADKKIMIQEILSSILILGDKGQHVMTQSPRDLPFLPTTLPSERQLEFERMLRGLFGMPPVGKAVFAAPVPQNEMDKASSPAPKYRPIIDVNGGVKEKRFVKNWIFPANNDGSSPSELREDSNILVRITHASICQTDRRALMGNKYSEFSRTKLILGHEAGGYIVDPGPWESELHAGQKCVILPHLTCQTCEACRRGMTNLCQKLLHLGLHLHGTLTELGAYPRQCVFPVPDDFPDEALPLVEPLACVLRGISRIEYRLVEFRNLNTDFTGNQFVIFGGGPIGCLAALAVKRLVPSIIIKIVEPLEERQIVIQDLKIADLVLSQIPTGEYNQVSFVACSEFQASIDAISKAASGGSVLLFSGINQEEFMTERGNHALYLEYIHRNELRIQQEDPVRGLTFLIGSSGYTITDIERAVQELYQHYNHYRSIQNIVITGLTSKAKALLSPKGFHDSQYGPVIARILKPLIILPPIRSSE